MKIIVVAFLIALAWCYICMIFGDDKNESSGRAVEEGLSEAWDEIARQVRESIEEARRRVNHEHTIRGHIHNRDYGRVCVDDVGGCMTRHNCPNCGAPIESVQCPYCGTMFYDFAVMDTASPACGSTQTTNVQYMSMRSADLR